jgi:GNAT superfamily N-acetyltransferase
MREELDLWLYRVSMNWYHLSKLVHEGRGVTKDRIGKRYWRLEREYRSNHFKISLIALPGLTYTRKNNGWISVGAEKDKPSWMIYDIQVPIQYQKRGLGTALVRAAIHLAQRHGASQLKGIVTPGDAQTNPFLPAWYAQLGFTVQIHQETGGADFWMDLKQP